MMTKAEFFKICSSSQTSENTGGDPNDDGVLRISLGSVSGGSGMRPTVEIHGRWCNDSILSRALFTATKLQGEQYYSERIRMKQDEARKKFEAWLEEWKKEKNHES